MAEENKNLVNASAAADPVNAAPDTGNGKAAGEVAKNAPARKGKTTAKEANSQQPAPATKKRRNVTYEKMIKNAITTLKGKNGSSQYAIAKFIEGHYQDSLSDNFKKMLLGSLKKLVAAGKLVKVKNSYKLPSKEVKASGSGSGGAGKSGGKGKVKAEVKKKKKKEENSAAAAPPKVKKTVPEKTKPTAKQEIGVLKGKVKVKPVAFQTKPNDATKSKPAAKAARLRTARKTDVAPPAKKAAKGKGKEKNAKPTEKKPAIAA